MDDIKLYASKKNHILSLLTITENFSNFPTRKRSQHSWCPTRDYPTERDLFFIVIFMYVYIY
jgi:hypothetical protein